MSRRLRCISVAHATTGTRFVDGHELSDSSAGRREYGSEMASTLVAAADYTVDDLMATVRVCGPWWYCLTEHLEDPMGDPELAQLFAAQQRALHDLAHASDLPPELFTVDLTGERELSLATSLLRKRVSPEAHEALVICVDSTVALLHEGSRRVRDIRRPPHLTSGTVTGLFSSSGGVPKLPMPSASIGPRGVAGDRQKTRRHHGRAWQALCLWSAEVVEALQAEGHPIQPGFAGENISITGLDWHEALPGAQICIGEMVCEVSLYALPCSKNSAWFNGGDFERMHHRREPGVSRVYATVIQPGIVRHGDTVVLS